MNNNDVYVQLRKRIETYKQSYPIPTNPENNQRFIAVRKLEKEGKTDTREYKKIRDTLIVTNGAFAMKYAIMYCKLINDNSIIDDIFQQAQFGIVEAVDRFDPNIKVNFTTFAYHYVKKNIIDYIKVLKLVKAPRSMAKHIKHVNDVRNILISESFGKLVSYDDIRTRLIKNKDIDIDVKTIEDIVLLLELNNSSTEDTFIGDVIDSIPTEDIDSEVYSILTAMIEKDLVRFDDKIKDQIKMRFGIGYEKPYSLQEIKYLKSLTDDDIETLKDITRAALSKDLKL